MKMIYVAGPFSAPTREGVDANIERAVRLGIEVAKLGAYPVIPHANTAHTDFESVQPYDFWIAGTLAQMHTCDGVIFTENYKDSAGACGELGAAIKAYIPCFFSIGQLREWLAENP